MPPLGFSRYGFMCKCLLATAQTWQGCWRAAWCSVMLCANQPTCSYCFSLKSSRPLSIASLQRFGLQRNEPCIGLHLHRSLGVWAIARGLTGSSPGS